MSPAIRGCILFPATLADIEAQVTIVLERDTSAPGTSPAAVASRRDPAGDIERIDHHDTPLPNRDDTRLVRFHMLALARTLADARTLIAPWYRRAAQWLSAAPFQRSGADLFQRR